jgi:hypothetical protein
LQSVVRTRVIGTSFAILLVLLSAPPVRAARLFPTWTSWPMGGQPSGVAAADFNGDGVPDAAVSNLLNSTIRVYFGAADATLSGAIDLAVGNSPRAVRAHDVNGDGYADLLVSCSGSGAIQVLLGHGNGAFNSPLSLIAPGDPDAIALGDLNHDGHDDVVACEVGFSRVAVALGQGDGTFGVPVTYATGVPLGVALGDLDGDQDLDVIVSDGTAGGVVWLANNGEGMLSTPSGVGFGEDPGAVAALDVDHDGDLDIAVGDAWTPGVDVWRNSGSGEFVGPETTPLAAAPAELLAADVTGDGIADLLVTLAAANAVAVLTEDPDGYLFEVGTFGCPTGPRGVASADADGDGDQDLYVAGATAEAIGLLLNKGGGLFPGGTQASVGPRPSGVVLADLDRDGDLDAAVASQGGNSVTVLLNEHGDFPSAFEYPAGGEPSAIVAGDWDADGDPDLAVADFVDDAVSVLLNAGDGSFALPSRVAAGDGPSALAVGDANGDGRLDLLVADFNANRVTVLLGNGAGGFANASYTSVGVNPTSVLALDVNGDGVLDLAAANDGSSSVSVALGTGSGTFGAASTIPIVGGAVAIAAGDVSANGTPLDLVVANDHANTITVLTNTAGHLTASTVVPAGRNPLDVQVADIDADGSPDAIVTNTLANTVSVLPGVSGGGFAPGIQYGTGGGAGAIAFGHLAGSHTLDLFVTGDPSTGADAWVLENRLPCPTPAIALVGSSSLTIDCHGSFVDPGATAHSGCFASIPVSVTGGPVNTSAPGTYILRYSATDADGQAAPPVTRTIIVADTTRPVLALSGAASIEVDCHGVFNDPGAAVADACDPNVRIAVSGGPVNVAAPGEYVLTYSASDASGNAAAPVTRTVRVRDVTPPVLALNGDTALVVECHGSFLDPGAVATDACDPNVRVAVSGGSIDVGVPGSYVLAYTATDASGNAAARLTRTVRVQDTTPPVLALNGAASLTIDCHGEFVDPGATASDACDPGVHVTVSGGPVNTDVGGTYVLTYTARDAAGNAASPVTRTVQVRDLTPPVLTLNGAASMTVDCHGSFSDPGAVATDACDPNVAVTVSGGPINTNAAGTYVLTYAATDASGNAAATLTRTVRIQDTTPPVLALNGSASMTVDCHGTFSDPGATATDACDPNVRVTIGGGPVNTNVAGTYVLTYDAADAAGNAAVRLTRTVRVQDITPPVLTLNGAASMTVECHANFSDPGATASDACDPTVQATVVGSVNTNAAGTYTLTYSARDISGNTATSVMRTVHVQDTTPPVLSVDTSPVTVTDVDCSGSEAVPLPAATATDLCDAHPVVTNNAPSRFTAGGTTVVSFTAKDASGNTSVATKSVTVRYGASVYVQAAKYTVGGGCRPVVTKSVLAGITITAYSAASGSCARQQNRCGGAIGPQQYPAIVANCTPLASGVTDTRGILTMNLPTGDYVLISRASDHGRDQYIGAQVYGLRCGQTQNAYLEILEDSRGITYSGFTTRLVGTELLIVQPEEITWDDTQQLYPYIFESDGAWGVVTSVSPPEGFVADYDTLSSAVNDTMNAVQFTITELGSDLVPTPTTFVVDHKGRRQIVRRDVGIKLTTRYARLRGFDVHDLRTRGLLVEEAVDSLVYSAAPPGRKGRHTSVATTSDPAAVPPDVPGIYLRPSPLSAGGVLRVRLVLPEENRTEVTATLDLGVYDLQGRRITTLLHGGTVTHGGAIEAVWNPRAARGRSIASGVYYIRASGPSLRRRMEQKIVIAR